LSAFSLSAAFDRVAYAATDSTHPAEVFVSGMNAADEKKLSSFNDALMAELSLSRAQRIVYPSKDGAEIEGWVTANYTRMTREARGYDAAAGAD